MNNMDINKLKDLEFKFVELDMYDEFEIVLTIKRGEEKINQTYYLMKIPMQNEYGREYNAISLLDERVEIKIAPSRLVKPLVYKKFTTSKEERYTRNIAYDMKYKKSTCNCRSGISSFNNEDYENAFS